MALVTRETLSFYETVSRVRFALCVTRDFAIVAATDMTALSRSLDTLGYEYVACDGMWKGIAEPAFFIFGMDANAAVGCGIAFGQESIIAGYRLIECAVPHVVTAFDDMRTQYGKDALRCEGYTAIRRSPDTDLDVFAFSFVPFEVPTSWQRVMKTDAGSVYRDTCHGSYVAVTADGFIYRDLDYAIAERFVTTVAR